MNPVGGSRHFCKQASGPGVLRLAFAPSHPSSVKTRFTVHARAGRPPSSTLEGMLSRLMSSLSRQPHQTHFGSQRAHAARRRERHAVAALPVST